jgi:hypothetical protein
MVAVIKPSHSMHRIFNYNENKVKDGVAECIGAENFPLNADEMSLKIKLNFLLKRTELRKDVERKNIHISLNFDSSENNLGKEKIMQIARVYMDKIGFGEQPYLVYQHYDAGHPHIHIVTTNIEANGNRIDLHHLGIKKSEPARKEIEKMFGLVVADDHARKEAFRLKPVDVKKVIYGRTETKRAITNVLDAVLEKYKYTSLPELNAVLNLYNIMADRGSNQSKTFQSGGLFYRILGEDGNPVGVPIKASLIYNKPTLNFLQKKFETNKSTRLPQKARVKNAIDMALAGKKSMPVEELIMTLKKQGIDTVLRKNTEGQLYGITYIDHTTHCVFNGSALGKQYSAKAIQERCLLREVLRKDQLSHPPSKPIIGLQSRTTIGTETKLADNTIQIPPITKESETLLETLIHPEQAFDYLPYHLKKKKRKKKKRKNISRNE